MKNWMKTFVKLTLSKNLNDLNQNKLVVQLFTYLLCCTREAIELKFYSQLNFTRQLQKQQVKIDLSSVMLWNILCARLHGTIHNYFISNMDEMKNCEFVN